MPRNLAFSASSTLGLFTEWLPLRPITPTTRTGLAHFFLSASSSFCFSLQLSPSVTFCHSLGLDSHLSLSASLLIPSPVSPQALRHAAPVHSY